MIGRGTRPQSSQSRPPRGGGRGRGYGGRGRGANPGGYSGPLREDAASQPKGENSASRATQNSTSEESKSAPPRGQRSPRRGGRGGGRGGGVRSETQGSSVRQSQDNQSKSSSSQPSVNPGSETTGQ